MRAKGFSVTLLDRLPEIGGRAQVFSRGGFIHDAGPTVITAPFLFDELYELFGEKRSDYLEFKGLDPWYRFYFHGGHKIRLQGKVLRTQRRKLNVLILLMLLDMIDFLLLQRVFLRLVLKSFQQNRSLIFFTMLQQLPITNKIKVL